MISSLGVQPNQQWVSTETASGCGAQLKSLAIHFLLVITAIYMLHMISCPMTGTGRRWRRPVRLLQWHHLVEYRIVFLPPP